VPRKVRESLLRCAADRAWGFAAAASNGAGGWLGPGHGRDEKGGDLFIGDECACQRPKRPTTTSRSKRRPREQRTVGEAWNGLAVRWALAGRLVARGGADSEAF
jgi:hypothetical protein